MIKPLEISDLFDAALNNTTIDPIRALATYADRSNWIQVYINNKCEWAFIGPTRPGYELAEFAIKKLI